MTREEAIRHLKWIRENGHTENYLNEKEALEMAIKALEQEPCEDCISRAEAIKALGYDLSIEADGGFDGYRTVIKKLLNAIYNTQKKAIEDLPSVQPKQNEWIPVSERLPEVGSEVLVCYDFKGKRSVYIADFYGDGEFHGYDDEYLTTEGRKYRKAVAWMPLPEPYKAESEGEK